MKRQLLTAILVAVPILAQAGIPSTTTLICPIGGQSFEITETLSCTTYADRTMSFAPTSSCDFITRLPQCPGNFLPMYKDFSVEEISLLRDYMQSESYESNVDGSRFYLAYIIEKYLRGDPGQPFWILLSGLWYDPQNTFENPAYMDAFFFESIGELNRASVENRPYAQALIAFAYAKTGQAEKAWEMLKSVKAADISEGILPAYITQIEGCISNPSAAECAPTALITMP